jgi:hypothetical protein
MNHGCALITILIAAIYIAQKILFRLNQRLCAYTHTVRFHVSAFGLYRLHALVHYCRIKIAAGLMGLTQNR